VVNTLPSGRTDDGCRADDATTRNAAGDYTYVIGTESQRATIDRIPGVTFLPFATDGERHADRRSGCRRRGHGRLLPAHLGLPLTALTSNGCPS
jgi:hypothetical protein